MTDARPEYGTPEWSAMRKASMLELVPEKLPERMAADVAALPHDVAEDALVDAASLASEGEDWKWFVDEFESYLPFPDYMHELEATIDGFRFDLVKSPWELIAAGARLKSRTSEYVILMMEESMQTDATLLVHKGEELVAVVWVSAFFGIKVVAGPATAPDGSDFGFGEAFEKWEEGIKAKEEKE